MQLNQIIRIYPDAAQRQLNAAFKYQEKFSLTLENLKCLNPDCNKMRKWKDTSLGFAYTCGSKDCMKQSKLKIDKLKQDKARQTYFERTGYAHQLQNPEVQAKYKKTVFTKTGKNYPNQNNLNNYNDWDNKDFWINNFITESNNFDYLKCMNHFNCKEAATHQKIKRLGINYQKLKGTSLPEQDLVIYLKKLLPDHEIINGSFQYIRVDDQVQQLDIYIPELKLAIEYNGIYTHSYHPEAKENKYPKQNNLEFMKYRHQDKSLACYNNGIRLLHIYSDQTKEEISNTIRKFITYDSDSESRDIYDLDSGCYPLNLNYKRIEPKPRTILKGRQIWGAGGIEINSVQPI